MRRLLAICALMVLMLTSCGATLEIHGTMPAQLNGGTCAAPVLRAAPAGWPMMMHVAWTGPEAGEDSSAGIPGQAMTFKRTVAPGTYTVRGWVSNAFGFLAGCDTTISKAVGDPPAKPGIR